MRCLMLILTACRLLLQLPRINLSGAYRALIGRPLGAIFGLSDKLIGRLAGTGFKLPAPDLTEAHPPPWPSQVVSTKLESRSYQISSRIHTKYVMASVNKFW